MNASSQFVPPPEQPGGNSNRTLIIVLVAVGLLCLMCLCSGICGGLLFLVGRSKTTVRQVRTAIEQRDVSPLVQPQWAEDWMAMERLTRAYTTALDTVVADKQVTERLGNPVEPVMEAEKLFRREQSGPLTGEVETIEFDISGPKGKGVVRVTAGAANGPPGAYAWSRAEKITVVLRDGSEIDVPPQVEKQEVTP
jgi:cytochrome oxidase complex assembly protein 1